MKKILLSLLLAAATSFAATVPDAAKVGQFYAGCQAYTFKSFDLMTALEKIAAAGGKTVEFSPATCFPKPIRSPSSITTPQRSSVLR